MGLPSVDPSRYTRSIRARRLRGAAALNEMLTMIGAPNATDHDMAAVLTDNELELRELLSFVLTKLAEPQITDDLVGHEHG
jgi:hypothetical protein